MKQYVSNPPMKHKQATHNNYESNLMNYNGAVSRSYDRGAYHVPPHQGH